MRWSFFYSNGRVRVDYLNCTTCESWIIDIDKNGQSIFLGIKYKSKYFLLAGNNLRV